MAEKITFTEAAKALGVHVNTLKNWQKAGRLTTATKVKRPSGSPVWVVSLEEAAALVRHDDRSYLEGEPVREYRSTNTRASEQSNRQQDSDQGEPPRTNPGQPPATAYLMSLQAERDRLMTQISNLQEERADYRQTLGELQGRVNSLEKQIGELKGDRRGLLQVIVALVIVALVLALLLALVIFLLKP